MGDDLRQLLHSLEHWRERAEAAEADVSRFTAAAEHTRAVLTYTAKGYQAGENAESKHWRERAESQLAALRAASVRPIQRQVEPVRIGAFDYVENADGTVTRKDWRDE